MLEWFASNMNDLIVVALAYVLAKAIGADAAAIWLRAKVPGLKSLPWVKAKKGK
jgi:hypothetical protein